MPIKTAYNCSNCFKVITCNVLWTIKPVQTLIFKLPTISLPSSPFFTNSGKCHVLCVQILHSNKGLHFILQRRDMQKKLVIKNINVRGEPKEQI